MATVDELLKAADARADLAKENTNYIPTTLFIGLLLAVLYFEAETIIECAADHYHVVCERTPGEARLPTSEDGFVGRSYG